jgi:hypothetical protein
MKKCSCCKEKLSNKLFSPNLNNASGLSARCKECANEAKREQRKDPVYLEFIRDYNKVYFNEYYHINKVKLKTQRIQREIKKDKLLNL